MRRHRAGVSDQPWWGRVGGPERSAGRREQCRERYDDAFYDRGTPVRQVGRSDERRDYGAGGRAFIHARLKV